MTTPVDLAFADVVTRPDYLGMSRDEKIDFLTDLAAAAEWEAVRLESANVYC